ncbi:hypothetical protein niasHS_001873 [Heterodera schachtii]|uniref:Uncharacterized protein n=1 Tax=Heterodera schachtii TaxID=97005 RepID=A0ABD2KAJ9_HETSC
MPRIFKILLIVLLAVISVRLSASTDGKKTANDRNGKNASAGIGTKIKGIVTAGLLITSLATGGSEAIGRNNAHNQGRIAAGVMVYELLGTLIVPSYHDMNATHFYQAPPPPPANFEKATPLINAFVTKIGEKSSSPERGGGVFAFSSDGVARALSLEEENEFGVFTSHLKIQSVFKTNVPPAAIKCQTAHGIRPIDPAPPPRLWEDI